MVLEVKGLCKEYMRGSKPFYAVDHVDFSMNKGDFVSIIGRSGSGKSTMLNLIAGLLDPTEGSITVSGHELGGMTKQEAIKKGEELLERVGIAHLAESLPRELSGGELRRVSIARALMCSHDLLVLDEPTGDLDPETTTEIMELLRKLASEGTAVLMVTHELDTTGYGDRTYVMDRGILTERK